MEGDIGHQSPNISSISEHDQTWEIKQYNCQDTRIHRYSFSNIYVSNIPAVEYIRTRTEVREEKTLKPFSAIVCVC